MRVLRRATGLLLAALLSFVACTQAQDVNVNAPFVTTPDEVVDRMLRIASTGPGDTVLDLGSGDGRIVIAAARDFGARGIGVDIDARLVELSRTNARNAGVAARTLFEVRDALLTDLSQASVVTVYLLPFLIEKLQPKFLDELRPGARIVTHAFGMSGWKPDRSETVQLKRRHDGQGEISQIHLWIVPAQARGRWLAATREGEWRMRIAQNYQEIEVELELAGRMLAVHKASVEGSAIEFGGEGYAFRGQVGKDRIAGELTRAGAAVPMAFARR